MHHIAKIRLTVLPLLAVLALALPAHADGGEFDCLIEPHMVVDVGSPENGIVETIGVERSDIVAASDVLAKLEAGEQQSSVRKARAGAQMEAEIKARAAALALAVRKQERIRELFSSNAISSHQRDEVDTEVTVARMQLKQARENQSLARIELDRAKNDLERRTIRSPISGIVVERFVAPGEYVHEKPLMRVAQMDPLRVEAVAPASAFGSIKQGMRAEVITENAAGEIYTAKVKIVDRLIDPASGTFGIRLELPNPDYAIPSGLNCQVRILPPAPKAMPASVTPAPEAAPTLATAAQKTTADSRVCRSFGPFADDEGLEAFMNALGQDARELGRREQTDEEAPAGFFVLTAAKKSIAAARKYAQGLRDDGIGDLAVLTREPNKGRVSLGLYNRRANAQAQVDVLAERGIVTDVVQRVTKRIRLWLDVELDPGRADQVADAGDIDSAPCDGDYVSTAPAVAATRLK